MIEVMDAHPVVVAPEDLLAVMVTSPSVPVVAMTSLFASLLRGVMELRRDPTATSHGLRTNRASKDRVQGLQALLQQELHQGVMRTHRILPVSALPR